MVGTAAGAAGAGGSARRRPPVRAAATIAVAVERRRALRASRNLVRMVLGFRGRGGDGAWSALLRRDASGRGRVRRRGVRGAGWLSRGHAFARRRRRDRRFRGVGSCGGRVFRWVVRRSRDGWRSSLEGRHRRESANLTGGRRVVVIFGRLVGLRLRKLDGFAGQRGHLVCGTDATFGGGVGEGGGRGRVGHGDGSFDWRD